MTIASTAFNTPEIIARAVFDEANQALKVTSIGGTSEVTGSVKAEPSTNFEVKTLEVTTSVQSIVFAGITATNVLIKALSDNPGRVRIGKAGIEQEANAYLLDPGEIITIPVRSTDASVQFVREAGAGTYKITVFAVN